MIPLAPRRGRPLTVLCLGAHCDDIEIGCGGTLLELIRDRPETSIHWVIFSSNERREAEARSTAGSIAGSNLEQLDVHRHRNGYFPFVGAGLKDDFESLKDQVDPDIVFTHTLDDRHQDHRTVAELTWNTFRDHLILEYEIPKYDGDLGRPSTYVPLSRETLRRKTDIIIQGFTSQAPKQWFTPDTFESLARLRGVECNSPTGYAEAFYTRKLNLDFGATK